MKSLERFELAKHHGPYERWPKDTELIKDGFPTGRTIPGYLIEAQYEHIHGYLLVTSWDCPFEEMQTFLLLSPELEVMFEETIGVAYVSVCIERHEPVNDHTVLFHCNDNLDIRATVGTVNTLRLQQLQRPVGQLGA